MGFNRTDEKVMNKRTFGASIQVCREALLWTESEEYVQRLEARKLV